MSGSHPVVERYLGALRAGLADVPAGERGDIVSEIEAHIGEALAAGRDPADVLGALGPADRLARAYAIEAALNRRQGPGRWLLVLGVVAAAGLPSIVLVPLLLSLGLALTFAGLVVWVAGLFAPFAPPDWVLEVDPLIAVAIGPPLALAGLACLAVLWLYARFLVAAVRRAARR